MTEEIARLDGGGAASADDRGADDRSTQTSVWQPRRPAFWLFAAAVTIGAYLLAFEVAALVEIGAAAWVASAVVLVAVATPVVLLVRSLDLYEREPWGILAAALAWGAIPAVVISLFLNTSLLDGLAAVDPGLADAWGSALFPPFVEEAAKLLGLGLIVGFAAAELDDVLDGFIWGAFVGVGFQVVENLVYFMTAYYGGSWDGLVASALLRIVGSGAYSHLLYTGITGMGLAYLVTRRDVAMGRRARVAGWLFAAGIAAHAVWNSPLLWGLVPTDTIAGVLLAATLRGLPLFLCLFVLVRVARRRQVRWFASASEALLADGTLTAADLDELDGLWSRWRARRAAAAAGGRDAGRLKADLQRAQLDAAMTLHRWGDPAHPEVAAPRERVRAIRARLGAD